MLKVKIAKRKKITIKKKKCKTKKQRKGKKINKKSLFFVHITVKEINLLPSSFKYIR